VFAAFHPSATHKLLGPLQVGELVPQDRDKTSGAALTHTGRA
jgi:hypothetical protein